MRMWTFARRNTREILRDPLNLSTGLGFPLVILLLLSIIQANIPVSLFEIDSLTPGITVFGLSFMTLFSALLISRDRSSSLFQRLYTTPMTSRDFILGYILPMLPIALGQCVICYIAAFFLGLKLTVNILLALVCIIPVSLMFIAIGLLCGSVMNDKQVGGICGSVLTNLSAWLSGIWFDLELLGGTFGKIAHGLPFVHAVEMERAALAGNVAGIFPHIWWVLGYTVILLGLAVWCFLRQMNRQ